MHVHVPNGAHVLCLAWWLRVPGSSSGGCGVVAVCVHMPLLVSGSQRCPQTGIPSVPGSTVVMEARSEPCDFEQAVQVMHP
jgi:hypothetical protein